MLNIVHQSFISSHSSALSQYVAVHVLVTVILVYDLSNTFPSSP